MSHSLPGDSHTWVEYDEDHRGCPRCGLRVFLSKTGRGWVLVNYYGVPTSNLLADVSGGFGSCRPPPHSNFVVLIDYTGNPDVHPGCERFMHRIKDELPPLHEGALGGAQVVQLGSIVPVCSFRPTWWELGPPRKHAGWTWCLDCFPDQRVSAGRRSDRVEHPVFRPYREPELPGRKLPALPPAPAPELPRPPAAPPPRKPPALLPVGVGVQQWRTVTSNRFRGNKSGNT